MMSAAAWAAGRADTGRLGRALDALGDSVEQWRAVGFDSLRREILRRTGVRVDTEVFARGYALDRAALALARVADSALVDLGGQFFWVGRSATARRVGIADPQHSLVAIAAVEMRGGSVSTSTQGTVSVTVLAPSGVAAAGWSAALVTLGCDRALDDGGAAQVSVVCADSSGVRWSADLEGRVDLPTVGGRRAPRTPEP